DPKYADDHGLLAVSRQLGTSRLIAAYRQGIFPWMKMDQPPHLWCWYSPNPRMLLYPKEFKISRSLARAIKRKLFEIKIDHAFTEVMRACARIKRPRQESSWIEPDMVIDYSLLHHQGIAHSIEADLDGKLVGGLYGLCIGWAFFGESMFHLVPEASKVCMAKLVNIARANKFQFIDCQVPNPFLQSLGARVVERDLFLSQLADAYQNPEWVTSWSVHDQNIA
ncbi:MAG: leucyl/phenylalanyl-tRNA--protein transferase, partial [Opitutae bacterium]